MSKTYTLHRNGEEISIEKETGYFTAIVPNQQLIQEVNRVPEVEQIKQVFNNVYKIKTTESDSNALVDHLRNGFEQRIIFHHAYSPAGDSATRYYLTDMVVVQFKARIANSKIDEILLQCGLQFIKKYPGDTRTFLFKVTSSAGKNPIKLCNDLNALPQVVFAEPNLINRFDKFSDPTDSLFSSQWHLKSQNDVELVAGADVSALEAWKTTKGSRDIVVAVVDDGFDLYHPDLRGTNKVVHKRDFVDGDKIPFPSEEMGDYHGTPCAGVAIGEENGSGILGIAPGCAFMPVRFNLSADDDLLWEIFDYTGRHADVISCSWGPVPVYAPLSSLLSRKFTEISKTGGPRGKGAVIVFAAGNFNAPIKDFNNSGFEWRHPSKGIKKHSFAILNGNCAHPDVITVSASTSQNRKAAYSNWGKEISVSAPSSNWHPLDPFKKMPGRGIWTTDNENFGLGFSGNSRYTGIFGGTSSATPLVAGIIGLIRSINPDLTPKEIRKILEASTDRITDTTPDPVLGNLKGTYKNKHSEWFGYGKINAAKAVQKAKASLPVEPTPEEPAPVTEVKSVTTGIKIVSALVNPKGKESGNETISLLNFSDEEIDLQGWSFVNQSNKTFTIEKETIVTAGAFTTIALKSTSLRLTNSGGSISILNANGDIVDQVTYEKKDANKNGWTTRF